MTQATIAKYLSRYAEPELAHLASFDSEVAQRFTQALVIPAYQESPDFVIRLLESSLSDNGILLIVVINQPDSESDSGPQQTLHQALSAVGTCCWQQGNLRLLDINGSPSALLLVDRYSVPIPKQQGVGLARKIGADLALALVAASVVRSPIIASSDADAHLPEDYFAAISASDANDVAVLCNFRHYSADEAVHRANQIYEQALRYYVAGLRYAGSAYAFFTIGSIIAFEASAYAQVRGFPKRSGGEDFYLLNKLAKLGNVAFKPDTVITLDARPSLRVPFGTGPAVCEIMALHQQQRAYHYYHPQVFEQLKQLLAHFQTLWQQRNDFQGWLQALPALAADAALALGLAAFVSQHQGDRELQFNKQLIVWFDAFKTLKFIHQLRVLGLADIPLEQALAAADFVVE